MEVLAALVFHCMNPAGTFADHFSQLFGRHMAESSLSDRRRHTPWAVFAELMWRVLRPQATRRHKEAFWRGWRLLAMDGTQFSLTNTPQIKRQTTKAKSRRGRAAFAKVGAVVLLELGLHNPVAAAIGRTGQSEWALSCSLLAQLPKQALLLADRLYGCAAFLAEAMAACRRVGSHLLIRVRSHLKVQTLKRYRDGSRLIRVGVRQKGNPNKILHWLELREIQVRVVRKGSRPQLLRLWTTLLDWRSAPADELAQLYALRWEHELYYRQIKHQLRKTDLLQSHTLETGAQEIAAIILASSLVAIERARATNGEVPVLRVSFLKLLHLLQPLWLVLELGEDLLTQSQKQKLTARFYQQMSQCIIQRKRVRSCQRKVRQPVSSWPRLRKNSSNTAPVALQIL